MINNLRANCEWEFDNGKALEALPVYKVIQTGGPPKFKSGPARIVKTGRGRNGKVVSKKELRQILSSGLEETEVSKISAPEETKPAAGQSSTEPSEQIIMEQPEEEPEKKTKKKKAKKAKKNHSTA